MGDERIVVKSVGQIDSESAAETLLPELLKQLEPIMEERLAQFKKEIENQQQNAK